MKIGKYEVRYELLIIYISFSIYTEIRIEQKKVIF